MKAGNINPAGWEAVATDRRHWRLDDKAGIQAGEERRAEQWDERRERWRLRAAVRHIRTHRAKHGIHLQQLQEEPADAESDCTAKEGAATQLPTL